MKETTKEEFDKIECELELFRIYNITKYPNLPKLWIKKHFKRYRKNNKNTGLAQFNWNNIV